MSSIDKPSSTGDSDPAQHQQSRETPESSYDRAPVGDRHGGRGKVADEAFGRLPNENLERQHAARLNATPEQKEQARASGEPYEMYKAGLISQAEYGTVTRSRSPLGHDAPYDWTSIGWENGTDGNGPVKPGKTGTTGSATREQTRPSGGTGDSDGRLQLAEADAATASKPERTDDKPPVIQDPDKPRPLQTEADGNSESTRATGTTETTDDGADGVSADRAADKDADAKRVEKLENELAESQASQSKLIDALSRRDDKVGKLEDQNDNLRDENRSLKDEVAQLRAELAEARAAKKGKDQPAEGGDQSPEYHPEDRYRGDDAERESRGRESKHERKRFHLPGDKAATAVTGIGGAVGTIAASTHVLTGTEKDITGAVGVGLVGLYLWGKSKFDERQERKRNADRR